MFLLNRYWTVFGADSQLREPVAQLDRVSASEAEGRAFESRRARQKKQNDKPKPTPEPKRHRAVFFSLRARLLAKS